MRSIIIDVAAREVREQEFEGDDHGSLGHLQAAVGGSITTAGGREVDGQEDTLYVNDEGLLHGEENFFHLPLFYPTPLAGNGVIVGTDEEGGTVGCKTTVEEVAAHVRFLKKSQISDGTWISMATTSITRVHLDGTVTREVIGVIPRGGDPDYPKKVAARIMEGDTPT